MFFLWKTLTVSHISYIVEIEKAYSNQWRKHMKKGRQYYFDVYIESIVDLIFGNAVSAFFENSEIKSLATNKGYLVSSAALATYGYVFYNNDFTFEDGVPAGTVDLGSDWDYVADLIELQTIIFK